MGCETIRTNIPSLLVEELSPDECEELLNHMEGCTQCRQKMKELGKAWKLMDRWKSQNGGVMKAYFDKVGPLGTIFTVPRR